MTTGSAGGTDFTASLVFKFFLFTNHLCKHCTAQERVRECVDDANETCSEINEIPLFSSRGLAWNIYLKREGVSIMFSLSPSWMLLISSGLVFLLCSWRNASWLFCLVNLGEVHVREGGMSGEWNQDEYVFVFTQKHTKCFLVSLLEYDTVTKELQVLMVGLRFPNGVQLSPAEDFVLVQETTMASIRRWVWLSWNDWYSLFRDCVNKWVEWQKKSYTLFVPS